jgi:hypothetical protein
MARLAVWSPHDATLGVVAPLALATAAGTALVVDLDPEGPSCPGPLSLADLVHHGPRRDQLSPDRRGVAVLSNGGVTAEEAGEVVEALAAGWPALVVRLPPQPTPPGGVVPVVPHAPGDALRFDGPAVRQRGPWPAPRGLPGIVLPRPRASTIQSLLELRRPAPCRWLRTWRKVWSFPWP